MLTKLILKCFKSFKEKTELDFRATGYEILSDTNKSKDDILKGALFVGGNATGKSNILNSLKFLLYLLVGETIFNPNEYVCLFAKGNMELLYEFEFKKQILKYKVICNRSRCIQEEKLQINDKLIIDRIGDSAKYTSENSEILLTNISSNASAVRKVYFENQFDNNETVSLWFEYLKNSIYIDQSKHIIVNDENKDYTSYFENEGDLKFNEFLNEIGYDQSIEYTHGYKGNIQFEFNDKMGRPYKEIIFKRKNMNFALPVNLESEGNKTLINVFTCVLRVLNSPGMILIDEFSSAFHNKLEEAIIKYFMRNSKKSQIFIASHSTNLLNTSILRPDQIYTVDFNENGSTIYRASEAQPREAQNLEKMYLNGVFNGVPTYK